MSNIPWPAWFWLAWFALGAGCTIMGGPGYDDGCHEVGRYATIVCD